MSNPYSQTTPEIERYADLCQENGLIEPSLYNKHKVNRGLRDLQGRGVLTGLTEISEVNGFEERDGNRVPIHGQLFYRGVNVKEVVKGAVQFQVPDRRENSAGSVHFLHGRYDHSGLLHALCRA